MYSGLLPSAEPVRATASDVCWDPRFETVEDKSYYLAACQPDGSLSEQLNNISALLCCPFDGLCVHQVPTLPKPGKFEVCFGKVSSGSRHWQDVSSALLPRSSGHQRLLFLDIFPQGFLVPVNSCEVECVCQTVDCWLPSCSAGAWPRTDDDEWEWDSRLSANGVGVTWSSYVLRVAWRGGLTQLHQVCAWWLTRDPVLARPFE